MDFTKGVQPRTSHQFITLRLNGKVKVRAIRDTGADDTIMSSDVAEMCGI